MNYLKIFLLLLLLNGCKSHKGVRLEVNNKSKAYFDSAVGFVNNHIFYIKAIEPGKTIILDIPISCIKLNPHDFILNLNLFSNNLKDTLTGMFYTDLGGYPENKYTLIISDNRTVEIKSAK